MKIMVESEIGQPTPHWDSILSRVPSTSPYSSLRLVDLSIKKKPNDRDCVNFFYNFKVKYLKFQCQIFITLLTTHQ